MPLSAPPSPTPQRSRKRILEVGVYTPGDLAFEVTALADVDVRDDGDTTAYSGHATVRSRFKGRDFSSLYRLSRVYGVRQGRWRIIAARTARLGDK
jgi:ketosteroid isomerase-like protein